MTKPGLNCGAECTEHHTYMEGCLLEGSIPFEPVPMEPVLMDEENSRDILMSNIPNDAYHDKDISGESWQWTTKNGIFRVLMSYIPEPAVVVEFKQPRAREDRIQTVISIRKYTSRDIRDFIVPIISSLS